MYVQEVTTSPCKEKSKFIQITCVKTIWKVGYAEFGYHKLLQPVSNFYM